MRNPPRMTVLPSPIRLLPERGAQLKPRLGAKLFMSFSTGPGTITARLSGSVAPNIPSGTVAYS